MGNGGHGDQVLHLKTQTKWHTGKRTDDCLLPFQTIGSYHPSELSWHSPQTTPLVLHQLGAESSSRKLTEPSGSFFFIKVLPLTQGSPSKALAAAGCSATSIFGNRSNPHNCFFSFLSEKRESVSSMEAGVCANRTLLQSLKMTQDPDMEEKRYCSTPAPSCRCKQLRAHRATAARRKAQQAQRIFPLSYTFSFINSVSSQQLHFGT